VISTEELGRAMIRAARQGCTQEGAGEPRPPRTWGAMIENGESIEEKSRRFDPDN
jgi:hypothetical protein